MSRVSANRLHYLRNQVSIADLIQCRLGLATHYRSHLLRFSCPLCHAFDTAINPSTNLARCFRCQKNFNPIDLVMIVADCSFLDAIKFLENHALPNRQI
jgi:hypothetical protein